MISSYIFLLLSLLQSLQLHVFYPTISLLLCSCFDSDYISLCFILESLLAFSLALLTLQSISISVFFILVWILFLSSIWIFHISTYVQSSSFLNIWNMIFIVLMSLSINYIILSYGVISYSISIDWFPPSLLVIFSYFSVYLGIFDLLSYTVSFTLLHAGCINILDLCSGMWLSYLETDYFRSWF